MHVPQCWQMLLAESVPNVLCLLFHCHSILQSSCSQIGFESSRCWVRCRLYTPKGTCHIYWYKEAYFVMIHCGGCKHCRGCYPENTIATTGIDQSICQIHQIQLVLYLVYFPAGCWWVEYFACSNEDILVPCHSSSYKETLLLLLIAKHLPSIGERVVVCKASSTSNRNESAILTDRSVLLTGDNEQRQWKRAFQKHTRIGQCSVIYIGGYYKCVVSPPLYGWSSIQLYQHLCP